MSCNRFYKATPEAASVSIINKNYLYTRDKWIATVIVNYENEVMRFEDINKVTHEAKVFRPRVLFEGVNKDGIDTKYLMYYIQNGEYVMGQFCADSLVTKPAGKYEYMAYRISPEACDMYMKCGHTEKKVGNDDYIFNLIQHLLTQVAPHISMPTMLDEFDEVAEKSHPTGIRFARVVPAKVCHSVAEQLAGLEPPYNDLSVTYQDEERDKAFRMGR